MDDSKRLPADLFAEVFRDGVEAPALARTTASAAPLAVYLGGQPGCGKSTLARSSAAWFGSTNFVHVDVDRLRDVHPVYLPMMANLATEKMAPNAVQRDCSLWADMLRDRAAACRRNVLIENTMRVPEQVRESAAALRQAGYAIEARILAVHAKSSEVSLLQRFEHEKRTLGYGREMPLAYHNLAAAGIVDTVRVIEAEKLVDRLLIFDRSGRTVYENTLTDGMWEREPDGARTMERFRDNSLDCAEETNIRRLWDDVIDMMERRGAPTAEVQAVAVRRAATVGFDGAAMGSIVDRGEFNGKIVALDGGGTAKVVVQKIGRDPDRIVRHDGAKLSRMPDVGEVVGIRYRGGVGQVSERAVAIGLGR